jgi:hypothetical protein
MNKNAKKNPAKRIYKKPAVEKVKMDYNLSLVMMTDPPGDPEPYFNPDPFSNNPFKFFKQ